MSTSVFSEHHRHTLRAYRHEMPALHSSIAGTDLVMSGLKRAPPKGLSKDQFLRTVTHLHLSDQARALPIVVPRDRGRARTAMPVQIHHAAPSPVQKLVGDVAVLKICPTLRVLYLHDNQLTSLRGLGALRGLTHLYAQNNCLAELSDFSAPPSLEQLHLDGNQISVIHGLEQVPHL